MKIHLVKTRLVNTYVVEYDDKLLVVDVAARCHRYVLGFIEHELKRDIREVRLATCSHDDPDHMGGVVQLAALCGAEIAVPRHAGLLHSKLVRDPAGFLVRAATALREGFRARMWTMYFNPNRHRRARYSPRYVGARTSKTERALRRHRLAGGQALPHFDDWQVVHTPGHSWDSVCFYHAESGSLLTGDTLLGSAKQNRVVTPSIYANPAQMQRSLNALRALSVHTIYPGHGSIISGSPPF